jgi:hypothetical protein
MKSNKIIVLMAFLATFVAMLAIASFMRKGSAATPGNLALHKNIIGPLSVPCGRVNICADPRLELLASVELNSGFCNIVRYPSAYKKDMRKYFARVRNHEAVKMFHSLSWAGLYVDVPPDFMIHLSNVPELKVQSKISDNLIRLFTGDQTNAERFLKLLRNYAMQSDIQKFFTDHHSFYLAEINKIKSILAKHDYVKDIEDYYGYGQKSYTVIASPLFEGNYGFRIPAKTGGYKLYAVIGGSDYKGNNDKTIRYLVWHEFSHSFINPLTAKYPEMVQQSAPNFEAMRKDMKKQGYSSWQTTIDEQIIRAVTIRLTEKYFGKKEADMMLASEKKKGFVYLDALIERLKYYEQHRDEYMDIRSYFPRLLEVFYKKM